MKRIKENQGEQGILFSNHYVGDRLSKDDEVILFKELVDKLDISAIIKSYSSEGGKMFSPRDQLGVLLYAFHKGITSSVKMAELIRTDLRFIYLAGGHIIKRRTICDFRIKHREAIRKLFESSVGLALDTGIVRSDNLFALDGSKIEAQASFSKTRKKSEWEERQEKIVEHVDKFLREWEEQDAREEGLEEKKREEFERIKKKLDAIKDHSIKRRKEDPSKDEKEKGEPASSSGNKKDASVKKESKAVYKKNKIFIKDLDDTDKLLTEYTAIVDLLGEYETADEDMFLNLTDPDCRLMQSDSITKECYNVQAISNNQVIVAADVTQDENDQYQLAPMVEQLKDNINLEGANIKFACDAGYNRGKNLSYIDREDNIDAYISMFDRSEKEDPEKNEFHKENFEFDEDDDSWTCPAGERLRFMKEFIRDGKKYTQYGCKLKKCVFCTDRDKCLTVKEDIRRGYRTIEDDGYVVYRKEMKEKMSQNFAKAIYSQRAGSVEPVFGQIKNNRGFNRFRLKRLSKVRTEFLIMAIAHNLGKIMRYLNGNKAQFGFN
jgi:transposase